MNDRSHGYETSVGYSFGFYREMAPDWLDLCVRAAGYQPVRHGGSFRYLELGCGQGFGLCLLAAANSASEFVGVDFQADHIAHAKALAHSGGLTNVHFIEADFADLAVTWPSDFGTFDYVTLHGILSWVSPTLREAVTRCLDHATHQGSLVYASYNTQPSWLGSVPFQHITRLLKDTTHATAEATVESSISLFEKLRAANAPLFRILPALNARLQTLRSHSINYLIHEYLNENWQPLWHSAVSEEFEGAGLCFAGSATIADNLLPEILSEQLRRPIAEQASDRLRQDLQDFAINQGFRRDIFCRGELDKVADGLGRDEPTRFMLLSEPKADEGLPVNTSFGSIALEYPYIAPILDALGEGPKTFGELSAGTSLAKADLAQLLVLLLHSDTIGVEAARTGEAEYAQRLNAAIAKAACERAPYAQLAAANLGSATRVSQIELLLLDAWLGAPGIGVESLAEGVWQRMSRLGQKLYHLGQEVDDAHATQQLREVATIFVEDIVPRWRRLGVVK